MGISIVLEATIPSQSLFSRFTEKRDWYEIILRSFVEAMSEHGAIDFVPSSFANRGDRLPIHCCEEWPDIAVTKRSILIEARTSTCGPGYHAMLCSAVDEIERQHGLKFFEPDAGGDETGYFLNRDFEALQSYFANWLEMLVQSVFDQPVDQTDMRLQMLIDCLTPDGEAGVVQTASGPQKAAYLATFSRMSAAELWNAASEWFPWWSERMTASDFIKSARQIMWCDIPWRTPADDHEKMSYIAVLSALRKAKIVGGNVADLEQEIGEMERFFDLTEPDECPPAKSGIGYRRHDCRWRLTPSWSGLLPGHLREIPDEDSYTLQCSDFIVRFSGFSLETSDARSSLSSVDSQNTIIAEGTKDTFAWRIERSTEVEDENCITSFVLAGAAHNLLFASFTHLRSFDDSVLQQFAESLAVVHLNA